MITAGPWRQCDVGTGLAGNGRQTSGTISAHVRKGEDLSLVLTDLMISVDGGGENSS